MCLYIFMYNIMRNHVSFYCSFKKSRSCVGCSDYFVNLSAFNSHSRFFNFHVSKDFLISKNQVMSILISLILSEILLDIFSYLPYFDIISFF